MSILGRFRRKKEDPEIVRRAVLLRAGRIGEATVLATDTDGEGNEMLSYCYTIAGVDYETMQRLDEEQLRRKDYYLPGSRVDLRYDPRRPANSVVV
jgi:hypothetical protein